MKIGEVAQMLGATPRTLRFYEEQGLLETARSGKGTRLYSEDDIARLRTVLGLASLGTPLEELGAIARARADSSSGDEASHKVAHLLGLLQQEIAAKKAQCAAMEREIERTRTVLARCFGCSRPPTRAGCRGCPTLERLGRTPLFGLTLQR